MHNLLIAALFALIAMPAPVQEIAYTIYFGGPIPTMVDSAPHAEALAVRYGRILALGPRDAIQTHQGDATRLADLEG